MLRRFLTSHGLPQDIRFLVFALGLIIFVHFRPHGILPDCPQWLRFRPHKPTFPELKLSHIIRAARAHNSGPLLEIKNVSKRFDGVVAVDKLSLDVKRGEWIAVIGPNGSGKSTLLNLITGTLRLDEGMIQFDGHRIDRSTPHQIARLGIRRSYQEVSVFNDITTYDNVYITTERASRENVVTALESFGLPKIEMPTSALSYGCKKSLDLARMCVEVQDSQLVLLDEPTAGLTQRESEEVAESLRAVRGWAGIALIVVSHDISFLQLLGLDRVVVLSVGGIFRQGSIADIRSDADVGELFWGERGSRA